MLFEKQRHYFDVIVEISSSLHKMGKMGKKKTRRNLVASSTCHFFSQEPSPVGAWVTADGEKKIPSSRCHLVYGITHPQIIQGGPPREMRSFLLPRLTIDISTSHIHHHQSLVLLDISPCFCWSNPYFFRKLLGFSPEIRWFQP